MMMIHHMICAVFAVVVFMGGILMAGYSDYTQHEAYFKGHRDVVMELPISVLMEIRVKGVGDI